MQRHDPLRVSAGCHGLPVSGNEPARIKEVNIMKDQTPIELGNRRELFWDDFLIDEATAVLRQLQPETREVAMMCDAPWEGSSCGYPCLFRDGDIIRLYYHAGRFLLHDDTNIHASPVVVCYAESHDDGRTFIKPDLGIYEYNGNKHNNIILKIGGYTKTIDNFAVFKDTNPDCAPDELYKAVAENGRVPGTNDEILCYYKSADGIHFSPGGQLVVGGWFDSLNCAFWDRHSRQYFLYMRDWAEGYPRRRGQNMGTKMRGIRYCTSPDFKTWSDYQPIDFGKVEPIELYTNTIKPYERADHVFLGMPARYYERDSWTPNFDYLAGADHRRYRCRKHIRYGTVLTDCILITSRDGVRFRRGEEAFMTPGIERNANWVYGDCYPTWGLIETRSDDPDSAPDELSFYCLDYHWIGSQAVRRYTIRKDGFLSYHAGHEPAWLITRPFTFAGNRLNINFATSAIGSVRITLLDDAGNAIPGYESCEIFGDSLERPVDFAGGIDLSALAGRPVRMRIDLQDADIFSFKFD